MFCFVSVLLAALVERVGVSRMQDFLGPDLKSTCNCLSKTRTGTTNAKTKFGANKIFV